MSLSVIHGSEFDIWEAGLPPVCNTGVRIEEKSAFLIHPDWVTLIFPDAHKYVCNGFESLSNLLRMSGLVEFIPPSSLPEKKGFHNYEKGIFCYAHDGGALLFSILFGGNNNTVRFEITGKGCARISKLYGWWRLYRLARRGSAYISRFDLAGNDYLGQYFNPRKARRDYSRKYADILPSLVRNGSKVPKPGTIDTEAGYSVQFGTSNMIVNHICYEKAKESKGSYAARKFPNWQRWEIRWKRRKNGYEIDQSILRPDNWAKAYFGACPYLAKALGYSGHPYEFIGRVHKEPERDQALRLLKMLNVIRDQYGAGLKSAYDLMGLDLFLPQILQRDGHLHYQTLKQEDLLSMLGRSIKEES